MKKNQFMGHLTDRKYTMLLNRYQNIIDEVGGKHDLLSCEIFPYIQGDPIDHNFDDDGERPTRFAPDLRVFFGPDTPQLFEKTKEFDSWHQLYNFAVRGPKEEMRMRKALRIMYDFDSYFPNCD